MKYKQLKSGLVIPVEKEKPKKPSRLTEWNCPHCNFFFDSKEQSPYEEATVGSLNPKAIPHANCPKCKECMGCGGW